MRSTTRIYTHPDLTDSDVWGLPGSNDHRKAKGALWTTSALAMTAAAASAYYVLSRFTSLGAQLQR
ncbi:hypothetical protein BD626DRAFT_393585 [Schizophyllum amplum]|uniref:Uncharacterized protein n=1 Tax=Schizophyllum amplum TaxID=97359 RepID=A0A550CVN9_9AGAR|nr:hypothetical protein BD626DRAFT_393585 [Auriculariopsis ampla]